MKENYIKAKNFQDFCTNQEKLIDILNHRMTSVEGSLISIKNDVFWLKKLLWAILGTAMTILISIILKTFGGV